MLPLLASSSARPQAAALRDFQLHSGVDDGVEGIGDARNSSGALHGIVRPALGVRLERLEGQRKPEAVKDLEIERLGKSKRLK